jgi:nucleotide sugar dehydrogenase
MTVDLDAHVSAAREKNQRVVGVIGLGFVGTAVAANLARTLGPSGPKFLVMGIDQDTPVGGDKCNRMNDGKPPVYGGDTELEHVYDVAVKQQGNLIGTTDLQAVQLADVVVFCINLDLIREPGQTENLKVDTAPYANAMREVGTRIRPDTLVIVESTLPLGMCDQILYPALCEGQEQQGLDVEQSPPLLAFCYERVMPGPQYLDSVNNFWRAVAGITQSSVDRASEFLREFVNTEEYPLWIHKSTRAAEMAKLLENSYRAANIAFIDEWSDLACSAGVDLFDVIHSIRVRKGTHDNMMLPGLGVGGYCLTKDALLAAYGAEQILELDVPLPFSRQAILTNEKMPLKAFNWIDEHFQTDLKGRKAMLMGITYRPQVADTRSSPSEILARKLMSRGAIVAAYDPLLNEWADLPEATVLSDPMAAAQGADIVVICLPDRGYSPFLKQNLSGIISEGAIVVDPWNMIEDDTARKLVERGITLKIYGRGDLPRAIEEAE